jgi:NAD+ kinase
MSPAFRTIALIGKYKSPEIAESLMALAEFPQEPRHRRAGRGGTAALVGADGFPVAAYAASASAPTWPSCSAATAPC